MKARGATLLLVLSLAAGAMAWDISVYATNWAQYREARQAGCGWKPAALPANLTNTALYAFAFLNEDFSPKLVEWNDDVLIGQLQELKKNNSGLKTLISIGGWTMNDPASGYSHLFTTMVETPESRAAFIKSALTFAEQYGFDGIDIDWEYPADADRGGRPEDKANYPLLLKELRAAMDASGKQYLLTLAIGAGWKGAAGLDLPAIAPIVDRFYLMAYDLHGSWEKVTGHNAPWEPEGIKGSIDYYLGNGIPPEKLILGLGFYGRSWTLDAPATANGLGAPASAAGKPGTCTGEFGFLAWREIKELLAQGAVETIDYTAKTASAALGDQWVSYDNVATLGLKVAAAKERGLGGVMVWAADLDDSEYTLLKAIQEPPASS